MKAEQLKTQFEICADEYIKHFCRKQGLSFDGWINDIIGGIGCFGDYFFNYLDIIWDINTKQPKGLILRWQDDGVAAHFYGLETANMNYFTYTKGLRFI